MKVMKVYGMCAVVVTAVCVVCSFGQTPRTVINVAQLDIDDLDLDFDLDPPVAAVPATPAAPAVAEDEDADIDDVIVVEEVPVVTVPVVEEIVVDEPVVEAVVVEEDDLVPVVEEVVVEPVVDEIDIVEPVVETLPVVEEVVVPVVPATTMLDLDIDDILGDDDIVTTVTTPEVVEEPVFNVVEIEEDPVVAVVTVPVVEKAPVVQTNPDIENILAIERARNALQKSHAVEKLKQAQGLLDVGRFTTAIDSYNEALKFLKDTDVAELAEANAGLAEANYRHAMSLRRDRNYDEALKFATAARSGGHPKAETLVAELRNLIDNPPEPPAPIVVLPSKSEQTKETRKKIKESMRIARDYYAMGEYNLARKEVEFVLKDNPANKEAVNMLRKIQLKRDQFSEKERASARAGMIHDVTSRWTPGTYGDDFVDGFYRTTTEDSSNTQDGRKLTEEMRVMEKLRSIILPEIEFRQANITDVVRFLSEASREYDNTTDELELRGVNIVLNIKGLGATAPASDDPFAPVVSPSGGGDTSTSITISARYMSLLSALDTIMQMASLKYIVRGNIIMIMDKNDADGDLVHRTYDVLPTLAQKKVDIPMDGGGADPFGLTGGNIEADSDWKGFFSQLGVQWPNGSTVQYMSAIGKLVVKNTPQNLSILEEVLGFLNVTPKQVEIEVRFVEVGQRDLESFGFEWTLGDDWEIAEMSADSNLPAASRRRLVMREGSITGGFNYLNNNSFIKINDGTGVADNLATFSTILTNPDVSLTLHMLSSKKGTDLLSAPKVVTQAGSEATIKVVTEYIYPTAYDVEMLESSNSSTDTSTYTGAVVEPQDFQMREVGVILKVQPEVTSDSSMINLSLTPQVVSEPTWKNYGATYPVYNANGDVEYVILPMEQPFFPVRSLATNVQIYNGATVVMGGMITEERYTSEDKIPILGDIPLLGHLFRYKYEQSEKRNLLLFVTARLVDPHGRPVKGGTGTDSPIPAAFMR